MICYFIICVLALIVSVFGCKIIVLDDKEDVSDAEELTRDLMALLASFSGKYYGRRSLERRKKKYEKVDI